jgi:hypothetical protein
MKTLVSKVVNWLWVKIVNHHLLLIASISFVIAYLLISIDLLVSLGVGILGVILFLFWIMTNIIQAK